MKAHQKAAEALAKDLRKTKGDVTVSEENGKTVVRTRDGDTHTFDETWKPLEESND